MTSAMKEANRSFIRNYYRVAVPGDLDDNIESLGQHAIDEARERARLHCMPCNWRATRIKGNVGDFEVIFRVCRTRRRS